MTVRERLGLHVLRRLVASPLGRAHVLSQVARAEEFGERFLGEQLLPFFDDERHARLATRHAADEARHANLLSAAYRRNGVIAVPAPPRLEIAHGLDLALDGGLSRPLRSRADAAQAYLLLQVMEERSVRQFDLFARAFAPVDPQTASLFVAIARDEARHVYYCRTLGEVLCPDGREREPMLARLRAVEAREFDANGAANLAFVLEHGMLVIGCLERWLLELVSALGRRLLPVPA